MAPRSQTGDSNDAPPRKKGERSAWTKKQIDALKAAVAEFEAKNPGGAGRGKWKAIAANVPDRNDAQCRQRWEDSTKDGKKEGTWSSTEDHALRLAVESTKNVTWRRWTMVAETIPSRTAKQCEYRYKHHLAPKRGPRRVAPMASKETLMAVNQRLQLLLTKSAVAAHPSHILDLALLCIAALPVETCSVIAEVQKLRYALQNQELEG